MQFSHLIEKSGLTILERKGDAEVTRVTADSRQCGPGTCFVAVRGTNVDGHQFLADVAACGASAVVCERPGDLPADFPHALVKNSRRAAGPLAQAMLDWPVRKLKAVGITGTNGKTTVAHMIGSILRDAGASPALLGTIRYDTGARNVDAATTTPGAVQLAEMCAEMVSAGRTHLVMEVSSHALHQWRVAGVNFAVGVFTNITGDHLDYHRTMKRYLAAKRRLFKQLSPDAWAVINRDDPASGEMTDATPARVIMYGLNPLADLRARIGAVDATGTRFDLVYDGQEVSASMSQIGRHNVYNALAASGACLALGLEPEQVARSLGRIREVPGRLQRVQAEAGFSVFVDYAHTDDALANVLQSLRPIVSGRLMLVFGCGGDRDRSKRPRMAGVAEQLADRIYVTSDNPRSESPEAIIAEILAGFSALGAEKTTVEPDRRQAIAMAVGEARRGDLVLIAGKGHETYQIIGPTRSDFDDAKVAAEEIHKLQRQA
ncbi:MAG: UDP-N-acetylmuramoyl-L-alanyl-D-glutamate--2,6-diaminopimelate ligase [Phycisphaerae bacterium]